MSHQPEISDASNAASLPASVNAIRYVRAAVEHISALVAARIDFLTDLLGPQAEADVQALHDQLTAYFYHHLPEGTYICYLACVGTDIAGVGGLVVRCYPGSFKNPTGRNGYILNMYTRPAYRKQGICTALLQLLTNEAALQGIDMLELHATEQGEPLYIKAGFHRHAEPTYRK